MNSHYPMDTSSSGYLMEYRSDEDKISDPRQALRTLRRHFLLFIIVAFTVFVAVAVYTLQATPVYSAGASVIIDSRENNVVDFGSVVSGLPPDSAVVDTEVEIIRSRSLAEKVVRQLSLDEYPEFNPALRQPTFTDQVKSFLRSSLKAGATPRSGPAGDTAEADETEEMDRVVSTLLSKTAARRIGTTYGIDIYANSNDPQLAAAIANKIVDQYLVEQLDAKFDATRRANAWLEDRLADLKEEVNTAESLVENYRNASGLITAGSTSISEQQLGDLNGQLIQQRAQLAEAEARLSSVREMAQRGQSADVSGEALRSPVISELRRQQAEINRERADLLNRYGPRHPEFERISTEEANIEAQISSELQRLISNLEGEVNIARERVQSLQSSIGRASSTLAQNNRASVRLRELERNAEASRSIYEAFLARFKQTNEQEGLAEADARILSRAAVPQAPSFPKTSLNLMLGVVFGLLLATGSVVGIEALTSQITSGEEVEERFRVPFLGNIPKLTGKSRKDVRAYLLEIPCSGYSVCVRNLRASIIFAELDSMVRTVAVTSSQPDEGKTSTTYALGIMSAMSGTKTLIIDGDFRRKRLSEVCLDDWPEKGFLELLFGECSTKEATIVDKDTGLHILPLTYDRHTPRDVFGSKAFDQLLQDLRSTYEFIIIDTGPLLLLAETRVLTSKVDQVVVVSRWLKTNRAALKQTLNILKEFRANIAGVVINQVDTSKYHRQGYGHSGYKAYSKYYS